MHNGNMERETSRNPAIGEYGLLTCGIIGAIPYLFYFVLRWAMACSVEVLCTDQVPADRSENGAQGGHDYDAGLASVIFPSYCCPNASRSLLLLADVFHGKGSSPPSKSALDASSRKPKPPFFLDQLARKKFP